MFVFFTAWRWAKLLLITSPFFLSKYPKFSYGLQPFFSLNSLSRFHYVHRCEQLKSRWFHRRSEQPSCFIHTPSGYPQILFGTQPWRTSHRLTCLTKCSLARPAPPPVASHVKDCLLGLKRTLGKKTDCVKLKGLLKLNANHTATYYN